MISLACSALNYEWGIPALSSEVAFLLKSNGKQVEESRPYAELWMGTHPNCPSKTSMTGRNLQTVLEMHPELLGSYVTNKWGKQLPFLFKVLSVNKALSIQSHPDKLLAQELHRRFPQWYPDENHKPEMALALGPFEALCGFLPLERLQQHLRSVPELAECVGAAETAALLACREGDKEHLRAGFTRLMTAPPDVVAPTVTRLVSRLTAEAATRQLTVHEALVLRLDEQYRGDVGVLASLFLNLLTLRSGEAVCLSANEPHAYLSGECVECMATSDNVIRAGLTPKFRHTDVLCSSLSYELGSPTILYGEPGRTTTSASSSSAGSAAAAPVPGLRVYRPPFEEFELRRLACRAGGLVVLPPSRGPMIVLVQKGTADVHVVEDDERSASTSGFNSAEAAGVAAKRLPEELINHLHVARGTVLFVSAGCKLELSPAGADLATLQTGCRADRRQDGGSDGEEEDFVAWLALGNEEFFELQDAFDAAVTAGSCGLAAVSAIAQSVVAEATVAAAAVGASSVSSSISAASTSLPTAVMSLYEGVEAAMTKMVSPSGVSIVAAAATAEDHMPVASGGGSMETVAMVAATQGQEV